MNDDRELRRIAEATIHACVRAARESIERGGYAGLCTEGRLDLIVDAVRSVSVDAVLAGTAEDDESE